MEAALRVNEIASSERPLQDAVQDMVDVALELLDAQQGSIMLTDDGGGTLHLVAGRGLGPGVTTGYRLAVGESIAGRVLATGRPRLLSEVDGAHFFNFVEKSRAISSSLVVPLRVHGRCIGVLSLAVTREERSFCEDDLRVAQLFADQASGLIHRARLHERAEQRSAELLALVQSSKGLLGTLDVDELLQHALDGGSRLTGTREGFACLFDADSGAVTRGVFRGMDKTMIRDVVSRPEVRDTVATGAMSTLELEEAGSLVVFGLRTTRGTRGVLTLGVSHDLDDDRSDLLRAFSQQCAMALGTAELHSAMQRKESELSSIIHGVPNPIVLIDAHGKIVDVNPAAEQLFGVSATFSVGLGVAGALGHEQVEGLLLAEEPVEAEVLIGVPPRTYRLRIADVRAFGSSTGRVLIMDDLTAEREIAQTQRDFVAMIGHELRTPLTIIKGFARTALRTVGSASPEEQGEALTTIDAKAAQLERLIQDLLYVSKIETREAALRVDEVHVAALVEGVVEDVVARHPGREVIVNASDNIRWPCDETKVALVLRHLVDNALKYSEAPGTVVVESSTDEEELRFEVSDRGVGLLSSDLPHIFERFRQVDSSSTREKGGTGVGLYLCAQLVRIHGGHIWVDSAWGKGSTFSFAIPRRAAPKSIVSVGGTKIPDSVAELA
jgi:two-component system, OmpR family, phosphate regulon sensor histidine kinase PhoR